MRNYLTRRGTSSPGPMPAISLPMLVPVLVAVVVLTACSGEVAPEATQVPTAQAQAGVITPSNASQLDLANTLSGNVSYVSSVAFSPDGRTLASGSDDRTVKLWRLSDGSLISTLSGHTNSVESVAFSPDGQTLASGSGGDQTVRLWNVSDRSRIRSLSGHTSFVNSVAFSPDGQTLASGSWDDSTVELWRVAGGK